MPVRIIHKKHIYCIAALLFFLPEVPFAYPDTNQTRPWLLLETRYTILRYQKNEDLHVFNRSMEYGADDWSLKQLFSEGSPDTLMGEVSRKVDALFERAQEILDMRKKIPRVTINIYPDREGLNSAYQAIYRSENNIRAWYLYEKNTIYINVADVHEGILAHEMAHSIIDHFLLVRPPPASAEILARYVDAHLHK